MANIQCDKFTEDERIALSILSTTPIKSSELGARMGTKDAETRQIIRELRLKGVPICSGADGFWMWDGKDKSLEHTKNNLKSRAVAIYQVWKALDLIPTEEQERWELI